MRYPIGSQSTEGDGWPGIGIKAARIAGENPGVILVGTGPCKRKQTRLRKVHYNQGAPSLSFKNAQWSCRNIWKSQPNCPGGGAGELQLIKKVNRVKYKQKRHQMGAPLIPVTVLGDTCTVGATAIREGKGKSDLSKRAPK